MSGNDLVNCNFPDLVHVVLNMSPCTDGRAGALRRGAKTFCRRRFAPPSRATGSANFQRVFH